MDIYYAMNFLMGLFGVIVLAMTYTYIDKMERLGCACSEYKYRRFIKIWSVIALGGVLVLMFAPVKLVHQLSAPLGPAYSILAALFYAVHLVYVVMTLMYIDHLMKEKCKCSEDVRRELLYFWFWVRALLMFSSVLVTVIVPLSLTSIALLDKEGSNIMRSTINPANSIRDIRKIPKSLKKFTSKKK